MTRHGRTEDQVLSRSFVIVGTQRTGSTLIRTRLDSHPSIRCHGEIFKLGRKPYQGPDGYWTYYRQRPSRYLRRIFLRRRQVYAFLDMLLKADSARLVGFKVMYSQTLRMPEILAYIFERQLPVVQVVRRNNVRTLISREIAKSTGVYHAHGDAERPNACIRLEPATLLQRLDEIAAEEGRWAEVLRDSVRKHRICYEDVIEDRDATERALLRFLGVESATLTSTLRKLGSADLRESLANFDEVSRELRGTRFESMLYANDP